MAKTKSLKIDPLFDGHPEKSFKEMTPSERMDYLQILIEFRRAARNAKHSKSPKLTKKKV
jgi:hypothetical protein